jgi:hypothetical protein
MVERLDISEFNRQFENFSLLPPVARLCFLQIIGKVEDEDFAGEFASGNLVGLIEICLMISLMENGIERSYQYFKLIGGIHRSIKVREEQISRDCEEYALDYSFDEHSLFQISYAIAEYLVTEVSMADNTELNDMCKYLEQNVGNR